MSYADLYFGKKIEDITYQDIEGFFSIERDESDKIEFKSYVNLQGFKHSESEAGVLRSIAAMLNSEGGMVIWGAPIGRKIEGRQEPIFEGELTPFDILIEKDRFIGKIADSITPSPHGIRFSRTEYQNKYVYIVEVEKSPFSPHQYKSIYYMRLDGQTRAAPHHYVEALFRKVSYPKLDGAVMITGYTKNGEYYYLSFLIAIHNKSRLQNEHNLYLRLKTDKGHLSNSGQGNPMNFRKDFSKEANELIITDAKPTLYYQEPYTYQDSLVIKQTELDRYSYDIHMNLYYGGKLSPLLVSAYHFSLDRKLLDTNDAVNFIISEKSHEAGDHNEFIV
jgi:hypothetical protein